MAENELLTEKEIDDIFDAEWNGTSIKEEAEDKPEKEKHKGVSEG